MARKNKNETESASTPQPAIAAAEAIFQEPVQEELGGPIPPPPGVKKREVKMELLVDLSQDELIAAVNQFAVLQGDLDAHQSHADAMKADLKSKEANINNAINGVVAKITSKKELRQVLVERTIDFVANAYYEVRTDTGKELPGSRRPLSGEERQRELGLPLADKKKSDFTSPADPLQAAINSELAGAPVNSGKASEDEEPCPEADCILVGDHSTHRGTDGLTWVSPSNLSHLREVDG